MNWVQGMIDDESIFPSQIGKGPFWPSSRSLAKMRDVEDILQGLMMELARMQASPSETISSPQSSRSTAGSSGSMRTCTTTTLRNSARSASRVSLVCSPTSSEQGRVAETVSDTVRSPPQHILPPLCALPGRGAALPLATCGREADNAVYLQFKLVDRKELAPLDELVASVLAH